MKIAPLILLLCLCASAQPPMPPMTPPVPVQKIKPVTMLKGAQLQLKLALAVPKLRYYGCFRITNYTNNYSYWVQGTTNLVDWYLISYTNGNVWHTTHVKTKPYEFYRVMIP